MAPARSRIPPVWLLGLANLPLGVCGGLALLTIPQLLAARHVPEPTIASITSLGLLAATGAFVFGPLLDVWFSRRVYAVTVTVLSAASTVVAFLNLNNLPVLGAAVVGMLLMPGVNQNAIGGWFGSLEAKSPDSAAKDAALGAWMTVANTLGFGVIAMVAIPVVRGLTPELAALILAAPSLIPLAIFAATPAPGPDRRLARESFARFFTDVGSVVRRPSVWKLLLLFGAPSASFALTNTLGGLGRDYHASEAFVGLIGGAATTVAGLFGSLIVPPLARRARGRPLYLAVGILGALFTLTLIVLPRTPPMFATAMIGENIAQSAALTLVNVLALQSLGEDNPLAATQFGVISCAANFPITYMQWVDGHAYGVGGLRLMYSADGGIGLAACVALALLLAWWARGGRAMSDPALRPAE